MLDLLKEYTWNSIKNERQYSTFNINLKENPIKSWMKSIWTEALQIQAQY